MKQRVEHVGPQRPLLVLEERRDLRNAVARAQLEERVGRVPRRPGLLRPKQRNDQPGPGGNFLAGDDLDQVVGAGPGPGHGAVGELRQRRIPQLLAPRCGVAKRLQPDVFAVRSPPFEEGRDRICALYREEDKEGCYHVSRSTYETKQTVCFVSRCTDYFSPTRIMVECGYSVRRYPLEFLTSMRTSFSQWVTRSQSIR